MFGSFGVMAAEAGSTADCTVAVDTGKDNSDAVAVEDKLVHCRWDIEPDNWGRTELGTALYRLAVALAAAEAIDMVESR